MISGVSKVNGSLSFMLQFEGKFQVLKSLRVCFATHRCRHGESHLIVLILESSFSAESNCHSFIPL